MKDISVVIVGVIGCCLPMIIAFTLGIFIGLRMQMKGLSTTKPTGNQTKSASGKFAIDD